MWDVLKDTIFYNTGVYTHTLESLWDLWRNTDNICTSVDQYVDDYFAAQIKDCGELLFDYDYNVKYFTAYVGEQGGQASYADIEAMHGTRIEYVRDWMTKRVYFFDGVFKYANAMNVQPYNYKGTFSVDTLLTKLKENRVMPSAVNISIADSGTTKTTISVSGGFEFSTKTYLRTQNDVSIENARFIVLDRNIETYDSTEGIIALMASTRDHFNETG
jgi:hypothetical protein